MALPCILPFPPCGQAPATRTALGAPLPAGSLGMSPAGHRPAVPGLVCAREDAGENMWKFLPGHCASGSLYSPHALEWSLELVFRVLKIVLSCL